MALLFIHSLQNLRLASGRPGQAPDLKKTRQSPVSLVVVVLLTVAMFFCYVDWEIKGSWPALGGGSGAGLGQ